MKYKLLVAIPIIIAIYLIYANLLPFGGTAVYSIDVGADDLQGTVRLKGPLDRISEPQVTDGITSRNLLHGLVYFDLKTPSLKTGGEVTVKVLFRDNFPEGQKFMIGAKNNESWSYAWKDIYVPLYESLKGYPSVNLGNTQIIVINGREISSLDDIPEGSVIAANTKLDLEPYVQTVENASSNNISINVTLRGSHTFYTYVDDGALALGIVKQDLNWYNGTDDLKVEVYSGREELIGNGTIQDDGDQNKSNIMGMIQKAAFSFSNLEKGVYRIELIVSGDLLIREIELDKGKLVTEGRLFLAGDSPAYFKDRNATPVEVYFDNPRNSTMKFQTYHVRGFQNITVKNGISKILLIDKTHKIFNLSLSPDNELKTLTSEKGDIIIDSINYFSFTKDSYFTPKRFKIVNIKPDLTWLKDNVDYVILEYNFTEGSDWKSGNASWNLDELYIKDNTLNFILNVPHLGKEEFRNYTIPVERIEIEVRTPPIWERGS